MIEMFCSLQMKAEIKANPCIFWQSIDINQYQLKISENERSKTTVRMLVG